MIWFWLWLGGVITFCVPTARFLLNDAAVLDGKPDPEPFDYVVASVLGLLAAMFWPLYVPAYYVYWMLKRG